MTRTAKKYAIYVLSLICCAVICAVSVTAAPNTEIERVLNDCAAHSQFVNSRDMSAADAAAYLATEMQRMDVQACPPEFRVAFQKHVDAWFGAAKVFSKDTNFNAFMEGFAAGYTKDPSHIGKAKHQSLKWVQAIQATYTKVTEIALAYGARVPESTVRKSL